MTPLHGVAAVASVLNKSEDWVTRQARAGVIPARKVGRTWEFTEADVQAYIDAAAHGGVEQAVTQSTRRTRRHAREAIATQGLERRSA